MRILYIGHKGGTSGQRAAALSRIGCDVTHIDPYAVLPPLWNPWLYRLGGPGIDFYVARILRRAIAGQLFDAAIVNGGEVIGPRSLQVVKKITAVTGNYCNDNPYVKSPSDRKRWALFYRAVPSYDLLVSIHRPDAERKIAMFGGQQKLLTWFTADEITHFPIPLTDKDRKKWVCDVVFVGTWMPGRGAFLARLIEKGIPLKIYGDRWRKAPEYSQLAPFISGGPVYDLNYTRAIAGAKIALVLLNGDNHDLHTQRSAEIPAIGTAMCAPRTQDHTFLYKEDEEAVFFGNADECAGKCKALLADDPRRLGIARAGHARVKKNRMFNEPLMSDIVEALKACTKNRGRINL